MRGAGGSGRSSGSGGICRGAGRNARSRRCHVAVLLICLGTTALLVAACLPAWAFRTSISAGLITLSPRQLMALSRAKHSIGGTAAGSICSTKAGSRAGASTLPGMQGCACGSAAAEDDRFGDQFLALCLAVKDQHADMREWIAHHRAIGVGKFYVFDAASSPPLYATIQDHIESGLVEYAWWDNVWLGGQTQMGVYSECLARHRGRHQFIGFIDADEFLVLKNGTASLPALLKRMQAFEPIGALVVNWVVFGSSGHVTKPNAGVRQAFTKCLLRGSVHNEHVKSIVNTDFVIGPHKDPHTFSYSGNKYAVNEHFQRVDGPLHPNVTYDKIALHHYVLKSEEEFRVKMRRGDGMGDKKQMDFFRRIDAEATEDCCNAVALAPYV